MTLPPPGSRPRAARLLVGTRARGPEGEGRRWPWLVSLALGPLLGLTAPSADAARPWQDEPEDPAAGRGFHLYDTQPARAGAQQARSHAEAGRWSEALAELQRLQAEVGTAVLLRDEEGRLAPGESRFTGLELWMEAFLAGLPEEARELYLERHAGASRIALEAALRAPTAERMRKLVAVARRWPLTPASARAWTATGDLLAESGRSEEARWAWSRAARALEPSLAAPGGAPLLELGSDAPLEGVRTLGVAELRATGSTEVEHLARRIERSLAQAVRPSTSGRSALGGAPPERSPFGAELDGWEAEAALPRSPYWQTPNAYCVHPVRVGDTLLVSNSRDLLALEAQTGARLWSTEGQSLGNGWRSWEEIDRRSLGMFEDAVEEDEALILPASDGSVVVAPLQVPVLVETEQNYNDLEIIKVLPERRLFAYSVEDGRPLWRHLPPPAWDGDSGTYEERYSVASPPVIAGGMAIVQCVRTRGRVDLHVAAYDLETGALRWNTPVITGQRPLNMFGRMLTEFVAPPVVVQDGRLVVQTQLGVVACLDLFTGSPLWETTYEQVMTRSGGWGNEGSMASVWANQPPLLHDGVILSAPVDSPELLALDPHDGSVLWRLSVIDLIWKIKSSWRLQQDRLWLLGTEGDRLIIGGPKVMAIEPPLGSLTTHAPQRMTWAYPADGEDDVSAHALPRQLVTNGLVVVPEETEITVLDARTGRRLHQLPWEQERSRVLEGNLLVDDGALFVADGNAVRGFFEWDSLLDKARLARDAAPSDEGARLGLAKLLARRATSIVRSRGEAAEILTAGRLVREARNEAQPLLESSRGKRTMHEVLRAEAEVAGAGLDPARARLALEQALELAPSPTDRAATLMELQEVLRAFDPADRRDVLLELTRDDGDLRVACATIAPSAGSPLMGWRLQPLLNRDAEAAPRFPAGLYARLEQLRLSLAEPVGSEAQLDGITGLYALLHAGGDLPLPWTENTEQQNLADFARAVLDEGRGRLDWSSPPRIEAAADAELSAAEGPESLALVIERWPHTEAALAAGSLRLERAVTAGDVGTAAEIVIGGLVRGWEEQGASRGFEERLLQLGQTFEASGNDLLAQAWWQHVGARWKGASQDLLARRRPAAESPRVEHELPSILEPRLELGTSLVEVARTQDEEGTPWLILQNERDVLAIKGEGAEPAWSERVNGGIDESHRDPDRRVLAGGWVHLALGDILCSWELTTGRRRDTTWGGTSGYITSAATDNGILFVTRREADATVIYALEPRTGDRLWRRSLPARTAPGLVLGDGYVVAIPEGPRDAVVLDQLTGLERSRFRVSGLRPSEIRSAFIEEGTLILPAFQRAPSPATNVVRAWSLDTGERAWQVRLSDLGRGYEATHVLRSAGRTWLVLSTRAGGDMVRSIHELQTTRGVVSPVSVAQLAPRSVLLGLRLSGLVELDDPIVLAADSRRGVVQAIDLEQGMLWTSEPIEGLTLARGSVLTPVVGRERVATLLDLSYGGTMLAVFDRARGHLRAAREFQAPARRGPSERTPELAPWNGGLWLTTSSATQYLK